MKSKKAKITIQDVADEARVSITTVSRVINNNYPVRQETREKIESVIEKLQFNPSILARSLIIKKTQAIGIVVPSINNMFFTMVVSSIEKVCKSLGYTILLSNSEGDAREELKLAHSLISRQVDGIVVIDPCTENMKNRKYDDIIKNIPVVFINGYNQDLEYNFVLNDERSGTYEALQYLVELGHREIIFIRGNKSYSYDIKEDVYKQIMKKTNLFIKDECIINIGEGNSIETVENACNAVFSLFAKGLKPTCFFACNDLMAVGVLNACKKCMIKVPDEVSIIGFDNIIVSEISEPKITTVDNNMSELGRQAANMLIDMIENDYDNNSRFIVKTKLVVRSSCSSQK